MLCISEMFGIPTSPSITTSNVGQIFARGTTARQQKIKQRLDTGPVTTSGKIMDKMRLGGGGRFEKLVGKLEKKGVKDPAAIAAYIGRKQLGKAKFQSLAAKGRRRALREKANA